MGPDTDKLNKSSQADEKLLYFQYVAHEMFNNNTNTDSRAAYKHVLIPNSVI